MLSKPVLLTGFLTMLICVVVGVFIYNEKSKIQKSDISSETCNTNIVEVNGLIKNLISATNNGELIWKTSTFSEGYSFNINYKTARITVFQFGVDCDRVAMRALFTIRNQNKMVYSDEFESLITLLQSIRATVNFDPEIKPSKIIQTQFNNLVNSLTVESKERSL